MAQNLIKYCVMTHNINSLSENRPNEPAREVFRSNSKIACYDWIADRLDTNGHPGKQSIRHEYYIREIWTNDTN